VRRIPPFVYGHMLSALLIGFVVGAAFLDLKAVAMFGGVMAAGALVSALVGWRWPGLGGAGWKLWLVCAIANPLFLVAAYFAIQDWDCLVGTKTGWSCLLVEVEPQIMGTCFVPPLFGLAVRWVARRFAQA